MRKESVGSEIGMAAGMCGQGMSRKVIRWENMWRAAWQLSRPMGAFFLFSSVKPQFVRLKLKV